MDNTTATLSSGEMKELGSLIGKTFEHYTSSPTDITPYVWEFLSFQVDGRRHFIYNLAETFRVKGEEREFPVLEVSDDERIGKEGQQTVKVNSVIKQIHVVNDRITVTFPDGDVSVLEATHALVFDFGSDKQLMFEQQSWNSETIRIMKGFGIIGELQDISKLRACFPTDAETVTERNIITLG